MVQGLAQLAAADPFRIIVEQHLPDGASRTMSREEFNTLVNRSVGVLHHHGVRPGDTLAIMATNSVEFMAVLMAAMLTDVSQVPVNWHLSSDEVAHILGASNARMLIADAAFEETASAAARHVGNCDVLTIGGSFDTALVEMPDLEPAPTALATTIYFTAGTTGRPKATRMAEMRSGTDLDSFSETIRHTGASPDDVVLTMGPLYHGGPLLAAIRSVMIGSQLHVMSRFDAEHALRLIADKGITHTTGVPTHFVRMLQLPDEVRNNVDVSSLVRVFHIGAIMPPDVKRRMIDWWGPVLVDAYGCSELGTITRITSGEWLDRQGSVGRCMPWFTVHIRDDDGVELPSGEIGTVWIESHNGADIVYLDDPERTAACHRAPNEFTLFDIGYLDDDSYLYLVDRRVDMIISGGVNIYPAEVESELISHPAVGDCAVFAVPDDEWGHAVKAAVELRPGYEASDTLATSMIEWLRSRMAHYKVPRSIDFHDAMPRSATGKIQRRILRDPYWQDEPAP